MKSKRTFAHYLAMWGCISTGFVYTGIGVIALLSFLKLKEGGADESSMLVYLDKFIAGRILIWLILSGMVSYIIWRFVETIKDPYEYGSDLRGKLRRTIILLSSLADALIAYSAIQVLLGTGQYKTTGLPTQERELAATILKEPWGQTFLISIGGLIIITGLVQMGYVISNTYRERIDIYHLTTFKRKSAHFLAWSGHFSRGVILIIIGYFYIQSGINDNPGIVINTDKAFDFIGDQAGHLPYLIVATGTICYGLFMFIMGWYYDSDKH